MNRSLFLSVLGLAMLAGCAVNPEPELNSAAPKEGSLGNGDFYFTCDDSVSCGSWYHNVSTVFPKAVAEGSVFHIQYQLHSLGITLSDNVPGQGYTLSTVGNAYLSVGTDGFTGVNAGIGTVWVKDPAGHAVDFTTITIAKPDGIVIYDGTETTDFTDKPFTIAKGELAEYRTVAQQKQENLAGVFQTEFTAADPSIVEVVGRTNGTTTLRGASAGKTTVTVAGAGLTKQIEVEVTEVTP